MFDDMDAAARDILRQNDRGGFTIPTSGLYPFQWNWDSVFAAWGFATFDLPRAWEELERLFEGQWESGLVPHILFRQDDSDYFPGPNVWGCDRAPILTSGISQPPVAATFIRKIYEMDPVAGRPFVERLVPKIEAWHRWFLTWRTSDEGAVFVTHPWEAGRDNSADWDAAMAAIEPGDVGPYTRRDTSHVDASMRPTKADYDRYLFLVQHGRRHDWDDAALAANPVFRVTDPGMSFILLRANRDLAALCDVIGHDRTEIDGWTKTLEAGAKSLWNEALGGFDSRDLLRGTPSNALTSASFLCWYAGMPEPRLEPALARMLTEIPWPIPSLDPKDPRFDALRYWRGPSWGIINTLIGLGLEEQGLGAQADSLRAKSRELIGTYGFAEYFDPFEGTPAGGGTFTWTAAVWLAWIGAQKG